MKEDDLEKSGVGTLTVLSHELFKKYQGTFEN